MTYVIISIIALLFCVLTVLLCRLYVKRAFDTIDKTLDGILNKKLILPSSKLADNRISKLNHKAYRILDMYVSDAAIAKNEKETIQGFISDMSHQMKTPLSGISMYSELLLNNSLPETERKEFLLRIKKLSDKMKWIMDCLIKLSRLEVGAIELNPTNAPVNKTVKDAIGSVLSMAAKKDINIIVTDFKELELYHDTKWTTEVITNLLENAIKYSLQGSTIDISVESLSLYTKIVITDNGIGVPKDELNKIFKRFYRGKNTKEIEGAGLGLYLAALIMEKQGGYIAVDSKQGEFTSFSVFLQCCKK